MGQLSTRYLQCDTTYLQVQPYRHSDIPAGIYQAISCVSLRGHLCCVLYLLDLIRYSFCDGWCLYMLVGGLYDLK